MKHIFNPESHFAFNEKKNEEEEKEVLPYSTIIDDVIYEYGDYYYRIKGFVPNKTGEYRIHNYTYSIENKYLDYLPPYKQIESDELRNVRYLIFDTSVFNSKNLAFPFAEDISVEEDKSLGDDIKFVYHKYGLYCISGERIALEYVSQKADEVKEVFIPSGNRKVSIDILVKLPNLRRIILPGDVRFIDSISWLLRGNPKPESFESVVIDNIEDYVITTNIANEFNIEYTGNANPSIDMIESYLAQLKGIIDMTKNLITDIPVGNTNKEQILRPFYYALVEVACEVLIRKWNGQEANATDLIDIENLLSINTNNPTVEEMNCFVNEWNEKPRFSQEKFRETRWTYREIARVFRTINHHNKVSVVKTKEGLPFVSVIVNS